MTRPLLGVVLSIASALCASCSAQDVTYAPIQDTGFPRASEQMPPPKCAELQVGVPPTGCTEAEINAYQVDIVHWRDEERIRMGLKAGEYERDALKWTQSSYVQPQMMVHERYFYDPVTRRYTVDKYVNDVTARYGGIDSVLIWHTYPNIGIDDRNQYDLFHDLPGGSSAIKQMVADFHKRGVRVLFPVMLWDQGTRLQAQPDAKALSEELAQAEADGINGDTLQGVPRTFREASDSLQHPLALEPEAWLAADEMLNYNNMSWGYWTYAFAPSVSRYKWLEARHMVHLSNRWGHDHTDDLQHAFFNGVGFESWENIWGIWNQMTPRDAETLRRVSRIERATSSFLTSPEWEPHTSTLNFGVFASRWPKADETLWTIVNRNSYAVQGPQIEVPFQSGARFYDLWNGMELHPTVTNGKASLSFDLEPNGYGAVLETHSLTAPMAELLESMRDVSAKPLSEYSSAWKALPQTLVLIQPSKIAGAAEDGMVYLPAADFSFRIHGIEIEGRNDEGTDVQYPWETSARRFHNSIVHISAFWIDKYPVTNRQFKAFLSASHYQPVDAHNFLKDWNLGIYPTGWDNKPVTWVSLEDARAYARWAEKRLPHEWEWQYAAQGSDGRKYPWGVEYPRGLVDDGMRPVPLVDTGRSMAPASDVTAHPAGASAFGVMDLVGNVWQWTDEFTDEHTRAAILRGGSHYRPQGSRWYFPQAYANDEHGKYLLMAPSLDRSGAIGFRCVKDAR